MQLRLAQSALDPQQQPIIVLAWIVQPVLVSQQRAEHRAQLQQLMPILAGAGQSAHLDAQYQPDVIQADLGK